jgi:hypothetical protein
MVSVVRIEASWMSHKMMSRHHEADWQSVGSGSNQVDDDVDIAACCFGVRARLMGFIHQGLSDLPLHTRQADGKASLEEASAVSQAEIDFGREDQANRENDLPLAGRS